MRNWLDAHPSVADALVAAALTAVGLIAVHGGSGGDGYARDAVGDLLVVALFAPLARRRTEPRVVLVVVSVAAALTWVGGYVDATTAVAGAIAFYGVGRYVDRPASLWTFGATAVPLIVFAGILSMTDSVVTPWSSFLGRLGVIAGSFAIGDSRRSRHALQVNLRAQAERAEATRVAEAQQAVADERRRIAREIHDVVAHSISVMVVQSVAAERLVPTRPDAAVASVSHVAAVGRNALGEMRRILAILDDEEGPAAFAPQPTLDELDTIVDQCRAAGVEVTLNREGELPPMSASAELSVVRIVQVALTNVLKHASQARAVVSLRVADELAIEVADDGDQSQPPADGQGRGLIGMRQRIDALGGTFSAGPRAGGGFMVHASVPLDGLTQDTGP